MEHLNSVASDERINQLPAKFFLRTLSPLILIIAIQTYHKFFFSVVPCLTAVGSINIDRICSEQGFLRMTCCIAGTMGLFSVGRQSYVLGQLKGEGTTN